MEILLIMGRKLKKYDYGGIVVPLYQQAIIITMYSVVIILAVGGNTTVCYIVFSARRMRTVMNFFIVSLALSDILMAVICIPFTFIANLIINSWPFGNALCPIVTFLQVVTVFMSSFTLVAISIDRYAAIVHPLRPKMTKRQALIVISGIWILSVLIPLPTAIKSRVHQYVNDSNAPRFCEEIWGNVTAQSIYNAIILLAQYFIPLVILVFTYGRIILVLWIKKTPGEAVGSRDIRMSRSKKKVNLSSYFKLRCAHKTNDQMKTNAPVQKKKNICFEQEQEKLVSVLCKPRFTLYKVRRFWVLLSQTYFRNVEKC